MSSGKLPITVAIPVKNESSNLGRCLSRLTEFESVVVIDSSSTDQTPEIARSHGARVLNFEWDGGYPKKRNWFLTTQAVGTPWVLFLDADEFVTEEFCRAARAAISQVNFSGYWLNYENYFLGHRLRHGVPQRKLALFRVGSGLYERIDEDAWSSLDMEIHEHPIISGQIGNIDEPIEHNDDRGIIKFIDRHRDYALWEAERVLLLRDAGSVEYVKLSKRQLFKYRHIGTWWYSGFYFIFTYFVRLGFLDGSPGLSYAFYKAWYFETIRMLIREQSMRRAR